MTTIATDGKSMAGDGLVLDCGGVVCSTTFAKVRRLDDGRILGVAGSPSDADAIEQWLNNKGDGEFPTLQNDERFSVLVLELDGRVFNYAKLGRRSEDMVPAGVGSGMDIAIGAMEAGMSPAQAVEIACKRHSQSGGEITALSLS